MYIVANCLLSGAPYLGGFKVASTFEEAVDIAVAMVMEQQEYHTAEMVREELNADASYYDKDGQWSVCIGQPG